MTSRDRRSPPDAADPIFDDAGHQVLSRVVRAVLHDTSNPLSGARLLLELLQRDPPAVDPRTAVGEVRTHFHQLTDILGRLRLITQRSRPKALEAGALVSLAVSMLGSETGRRGIEVSVALGDEPLTLVGRQEVFTLVMCGTLLASIERAIDGDRLELRIVETTERRALELRRLDGEAEVAAELGLDFGAVRRWASSFGGVFSVAPGDRPGRDPDWRLELPPMPQGGE